MLDFGLQKRIMQPESMSPFQNLLWRDEPIMARTTRVLTVALFALLVSSSAVSAQWEAGKWFAGPHIGLSGVGSTISFGAAAEKAYNKNIGITGMFDYWSYDPGGFSDDFNYRYIAIAGLGSYHFIVTNTKIDPFLGLGLGYYVVSVDCPGSFDCDASTLFFAGQAGARYFFKPNLAGVARAGTGAGILSFGVEWKS
jgi:hypothetical protein